MQEHRLALKPGYQLDYFRIESVLGKGGFGITYLAVDLRLGKRVAIKELLPDSIATRVEGFTVVPQSSALGENWRWARERFLEEARVLAGFSHPAIVGVHLLLEAHGTVYMVMDYVEGESYEERLKRIGREPDQNSLMSVMGPILDGLEEVHAKGLMHRDIKPENILINSRGQPVLIDFGSARESVGKTMTMTSIVTHGYSPIEQYQTKGRMGPWTDIYAMGAVMCRAMTGEKPPVAADRLMDDDFAWLSYQKLSGYSEQFRQAVDWSLRVKPDERPQSIGQWMPGLTSRGFSSQSLRLAAAPVAQASLASSASQAESHAPIGQSNLRPGKIIAFAAVGVVAMAVLMVLVVAGVSGLMERHASPKQTEAAVAPSEQSVASTAPPADAISDPVEPAPAADKPLPAAATPVKALVIGDSFSVGPFGQVLGDLLMQDFGRERICLFASCGSSPEDWLSGDYVTDCGYRQTTPSGRLLLDYENGQPPRPVKTPKLRTLLGHYRPETVIVQLGTNWMDKLSEPNHPDAAHYQGLITEFVRELRRSNPSVSIFWVLPPSSSKYPALVHDQVETWINSVSRDLGFYTINSRLITGPYRSGASTSDGVHYTDGASRSWARGVHGKFAAAVSALQRAQSAAQGTGPDQMPDAPDDSARDAGVALGNPPTNGALQIFPAGIDAFFPSGYAVYDDRGQFLKRVDGPVSAQVRGQTSGKPFIRGTAFLSDWSYNRMQQGHPPNWMAGDAVGGGSPQNAGSVSAPPTPGTAGGLLGHTPAPGELQIFNANLPVVFPAGYAVYDDSGKFIKKVPGPASALLRGQSAGKPFAPGVVYLSDWSYGRMQQGHPPNWIVGEPVKEDGC